MPYARSMTAHAVALLSIAACATFPASHEPEYELWKQVAASQPPVVDFSAPVDLTRITHMHDLAVDLDVPRYTSVVLENESRTPPDSDRKPHATLTLYNIDPPLEDFASKEAGVDRGLDFRDPSNLVKSAFSNYVSPVFTAGERRRPVPAHPIDHFLVKLRRARGMGKTSVWNVVVHEREMKSFVVPIHQHSKIVTGGRGSTLERKSNHIPSRAFSFPFTGQQI